MQPPPFGTGTSFSLGDTGASDSSQRILIIGAGTWGCSIALALARRGFTDIVVLDALPFPSVISAGNDLNKIAEEANEPSPEDSDEDFFWHRVHEIAMNAWKHDPLLQQFYHPTGFIMASVGDDAYERTLAYAKEEHAELVPLQTADDFHSTMPNGILTGPFPGWRGFWKRGGAGWVSASAALKAMSAEAEKRGVLFMTGPAKGKVESFLTNASGDAVSGVRTEDGVEHCASQVILAAGAGSDLLLDFEKQLRPTSWTLAHLPLSPEESKLYKDLPVLYGNDRGFFIEPDAEKHELKLCDEHPGYCNFLTLDGQMRSVPFARHQIPKEAENRMRQMLRETMPQLAEREFTFARICWDADTVDRRFLIDRHPRLANLVVAAGGSGHGFMTCPAVGILVADVLEGKLEDRIHKMMRWRPEIALNRDWLDTQNRFGADGKVMDFQSVREWTKIGEE